jgi:hypothetical protein
MRLLLTIAFIGILNSPSNDTSRHIQKEISVYICTGKSAYSYHNNRSCRGLNRCSAEIKSVSLEYAKNIGRSPCKICY